MDIMKIRIRTTKKAGSCNFCQQGKECLPKYVYEVEGKSILIRVCRDCVEEFALRVLALPAIGEKRGM